MMGLLLSVILMGSNAAAAEKSVLYTVGDKFSCQIPAQGWEVKRDEAKESTSKIYQVELMGPRADNAPVIIYASYYAQGNNIFSDHKDFIGRNSKSILGETESDTEKFSPVKETTLGKRKAFVFDSEIKEYLHPESKSDKAVIIKEKFYVIPSKNGFYVLHYYAPKSAFSRYSGVFTRLVTSFQGK